MGRMSCADINAACADTFGTWWKGERNMFVQLRISLTCACRFDKKLTAYLPYNKAWVKEKVLRQLQRQAGIK
jgi:hypothetical protein